ncbi:MAG: 30S ribosomal protein S4 [Elusimicrobia bacterium RIFCSPLOWO2_01_FULL_59_12]|nr:MAG: 30S ribosomal protein S4 [Elusimicrobia bacterium RIFCSPLOWO2_01_FULL_59_12]
MSRYTGPVCRLCRRETAKLFLKGNKCYTACILDKGIRKSAPGMHVRSRRAKTSEYAKRLREKQKTKRIAGLTEQQFRHYFRKAQIMPGLTGENLLRLLETRLDHVVRRMGFALSEPHARQMVFHGHVQVNDQRVDIPSYAVQPGDRIGLSEAMRQNGAVQQAIQATQKRGPLPTWLETNPSHASGKMRSWPTREEISYPVDEQLIVELYSK